MIKFCNFLLKARRKTLFLSVASLSFSCALSAASLDEADLIGDDLLFDNISSVFTASKYEQKVTEAPARVSVVTAEEIKGYGHRTLIDVLNSLPGFQSTDDHNYSYIGVRGVNIPGDFNSRVLLLVDGHRINENVYDGVIAGRGAIVQLDMIDRLEVVRGPASSLYGSSAFLGVINIITKTGRDLNGAEASLGAGSWGTYQGRASYGKKFSSGIEWLFSANHFQSDGNNIYYPEFDSPSTNNGIADHVNDSNSKKLFTKLSYGDFTLTAGYAEVEVGVPTASYETIFNDNRTRTVEGQGYLHLDYQGLLDEVTELSIKLSYDDYKYDGDYVYDYPPVTLYKDKADGEWWGFESQLSKIYGDHRISAGVEYKDSLKQEQRAYDVFASYLDVDTTQYVVSAYLQDEWRVYDSLILNLGLRYDDYSTSESTVNPRAALIFNASETTTLKLLYGSAFRAPNAYELFYDDGGVSQKAAKVLKPETIESFEFIWSQGLSDEVDFIASVYDNEVKEIITSITDPADDLVVFVNKGGLSAYGGELELIGNYQNGITGSISYSHHETELSSGKNVPNYAQNIFKLSMLTPLPENKLSVGIEVQYEDGRETLKGSESDSRVLTNLTLNSSWIEDLELSISAYNLFDESYSTPGFLEHIQNTLPQSGRSYRIKAIYSF